MKQTEITKKQENKAIRGIYDLTGQLSQVLKVFDGIYHRTLPDTNGLTVEDTMLHFGVPRFVTPKGVKKGYTPGLINAAWRNEMLLKSDDGKVLGNCVFKNVAAKYMMVGDDDKKRAYRVYESEAEALKEDGKPLSLYKLVQIDPCRWSVRAIMKGLKQSKEYDKESKKAESSATAWEDVKECWIVVTKGSVRVAKRIDKSSVEF